MCHLIFVDRANRRCSREWMPGHAANALTVPSDRGQFTTRKLIRNPSSRVNGNLRFPLTLTYHGHPETSVAKTCRHYKANRNMFV
jgi:hypothetical protein